MCPARDGARGTRPSSRPFASGATAALLRGGRGCNGVAVRRSLRRRVRGVGVADIGGWVESDFEPVLDAFAENFDSRGEVGAAVCVYVHGRVVVDLWGGSADATSGRPWASDSVVLVFSSTKGVTSVVANLLIERGRIDPTARVAEHWPEFAAAGKEEITVAQLMSHQAGLPLVEGEFTLDEVLGVGSDGARARRARNRSGRRAPATATTCAPSGGWWASSCAGSTAGRSAPFGARRSPRHSGWTSGSGCPRRSNRGWRVPCRPRMTSEHCSVRSPPTSC